MVRSIHVDLDNTFSLLYRNVPRVGAEAFDIAMKNWNGSWKKDGIKQ